MTVSNQTMSATETGDPAVLAPHSGSRFRARFIARWWMRRALARATSGRVLEGGFALLRSPILRPFARHVLFGRGSFPPVAPLGPSTGRSFSYRFSR